MFYFCTRLNYIIPLLQPISCFIKKQTQLIARSENVDPIQYCPLNHNIREINHTVVYLIISCQMNPSHSIVRVKLSFPDYYVYPEYFRLRRNIEVVDRSIICLNRLEKSSRVLFLCLFGSSVSCFMTNTKLTIHTRKTETSE